VSTNLKPLAIPDSISNENFSVWRDTLKRALLQERNYRSDLSGKLLIYNGCHLHEGIVSRATVPRGIWWHYRIFHSCNSILLLPDEHIPQPPSREWCVGKLYEYYGRDAVRDWFYSLPWKAIPFHLP